MGTDEQVAVADSDVMFYMLVFINETAEPRAQRASPPSSWSEGNSWSCGLPSHLWGALVFHCFTVSAFVLFLSIQNRV